MGFWTYSTSSANHLITGTPENDYGTYFLMDQSITDRLSIFARYGVANSHVRNVGSNISAGFAVKGLIPRRSNDKFGIAMTRVNAGDEYKTSQASAGTKVKDNETVLEANYRIEVMPGLAVQPDYQYVMNPSFVNNNAHVVAARFEFNF